MKKILQIIITLMVISTASFAAQARGGVITFTQPDGTTFSGLLKGDASFHWIESDAQIVLYNPKDKYYYNAIVNAQNQLEFTNKKTKSISSRAAGISKRAQINAHKVSELTEKELLKMHSVSKKGLGPR